MWHPGQFQEKIEPLIAVFKLLEPVLAAEADGLGVCVLGEGPRLVVQKFSHRQRILQATEQDPHSDPGVRERESFIG